MPEEAKTKAAEKKKKTRGIRLGKFQLQVSFSIIFSYINFASVHFLFSFSFSFFFGFFLSDMI